MTSFEIKENVEIQLNVEIEDGEMTFVPYASDVDWASYSLEKGSDLIAENVSYEGLTVHDEEALIEWYRLTDPKDFAFAVENEFDVTECAEQKLREALGGADELYEASITNARKTALEGWLNIESAKVYRNDIRGFGNEFNLTFVMEGSEYTPDEDEYEVQSEQVATMLFLYADDPTTEDYSSATVIQ